MHITLTEAAARAKMPYEDLLRFIENHKLTAERSSNDAQYLISEEDLEAFLNKRSFESFWNNDDEVDNVPVEKQPFAQSNNLRRVLTAEAVAELKIEHQVLMSRVETLERLFSEFMAMEKTEKTLVLEESWKIEPTTAREKSTLPVPDQPQIGGQNDDNVISNDAVSTKIPQDNVAVKSVKEAQAVKADDAKSIGGAETPMKDDVEYDQSESENIAKHETLHQAAKKDEGELDVASATSNSAKDLLTKKLIDASNDRLHAEEGQEQEPGNENQQVDSSIAARLAEYERRLVEAKNTATQIWH